MAREIHPAGSTGSFGISARWQNGELNADQIAVDEAWNNGNDNDAEHGLDGFFAAKELFNQDYNAALNAGCAVID